MIKAYPFVYGAVGVHPDDAGIMTQDTLDEIRRLSHLKKMVAIGEIGLDYYWHKEAAEHKQQQEMFRAQMDIAREEKLPFMIHSRDAAEDTLEIVKEYMKKDMSGGIIHCFSYSKEIAAEYLKMGLYLGIGGVLTFKNAKKLKEVAAIAPLSQIVLETDNLIRGAYGSKIKVFDHTIPRSVRAAEISAVGKSIFQHDPKGKVAEAYKSLTREVMANAEKQLKRVAERGR